VRIKLGIKALSIVSSMALSLVVITGCNEEPTTPATPSTPAVKPAPGDTPKPPAPPATAPKADEKKP
jgi:hypothetical protein